jgi:hypothetical protein
MFWAKELGNKIFEIEAEIAGVAGSYAQNRQRKYQEFYSKDWTTTCLLLVLLPLIPQQRNQGAAKGALHTARSI